MIIAIRDFTSGEPIEDGRVYVEKDGKGIYNEPIMEGQAYVNISYGDDVLLRVRSSMIGYKTYEFRGTLTGRFGPIIYMEYDAYIGDLR